MVEIFENKAYYYKIRKDLISKGFEGKWVVIYDRKYHILDHGSSAAFMIQHHLKDEGAFNTWIGREGEAEKEQQKELFKLILLQDSPDKNVNIEDIICLTDLKINETHLHWKQHPRELIKISDFKSIYGSTARTIFTPVRLFASLLIRTSRKSTIGIPITFLIDTGAPISIIQKKALESIVEHLNYVKGTSSKLFIGNAPFTPHLYDGNDSRFSGINVLGMDVISTNGLYVQGDDDDDIMNFKKSEMVLSEETKSLYPKDEL